MLLGRRSGRELGHGSPRGWVGSCSVGWPQGPGPCCAQGRLGGHGALPRDQPSPRPPAGPLAPVPTGGSSMPRKWCPMEHRRPGSQGDPGWWASGARRVRWQQRLWVQIEKVPGGEPWRGTAGAPSSRAVSWGPREDAGVSAGRRGQLPVTTQTPPARPARASARETRPPVALGPAGDPGGRLLTPGGTLSCLLPVPCQDHVGPGVSVQGGRLGVRPSSRPIPPSASLTVTGNGLTKP